jgi:hypothetical protein
MLIFNTHLWSLRLRIAHINPIKKRFQPLKLVKTIVLTIRSVEPTLTLFEEFQWLSTVE